MKELIDSINELLGKNLLVLDCSNGGYKVQRKEKNGVIDISQRGSKKEICFFLNGMLQTLELIRKENKYEWKISSYSSSFII